MAPLGWTVTAPVLPLLEEIQRHVVLTIGKLTFSWLPMQLLPMLPNEGT
jgi:hypothetical protein